jgi:DNA-binding IclR family transcriptional regulator
VYFTKKITYLTSCGKCLTHWLEEEEEEETLLLTMCLQNSDNYNADF